MGLFVFNNMNQAQPSYCLKLVSKWCLWAGAQLRCFQAPVASSDWWQVETGFVQGNITFAEVNDIYLQSYPPASKVMVSITQLMSTT